MDGPDSLYEAKELSWLQIVRTRSGAFGRLGLFAGCQHLGPQTVVRDRDLKSKRAFGFILLLFTLADTGGAERVPLLSIPIN